MSVKDALTSIVEILSDSEQRKLLLEASKMVQTSPVPELIVLPLQPRIAIGAKPKIAKKKMKKKTTIKGQKPGSLSKLNTPKGPFTVFGIEKASCRAVANHFGLNYGTFLHRIRKSGANMEDVITSLSSPPTKSPSPETGRVPVRRRPKAENRMTH